MSAEARIKSFLHWVDQPRNMVRTAGLVFLVGTGATYMGVTGIVVFEQQIDRQVDEAMEPLSDEEARAAVRRFAVHDQIRDLAGAEWNRTLNLFDVEDLKRRISTLSQISAGLNSEEAAQDLAIMTLKSERMRYASTLKQSGPFGLSQLKDIVSVAVGGTMTLLGTAGLLGGGPIYLRELIEKRRARTVRPT